MDLKQEAARAAATLLSDQKMIGLGEGTSIAFLVAEIVSYSPVSDRIFYTSSEKTKKLLTNAGYECGNIDQTSSIDIYFDGCDQIDHQLNALKSGAGIHTMEKLLASMAGEFVLLGDESKYVPQFDGKYPLVLELIPEALLFVRSKIAMLAPGTRVSQRKTGTLPELTRHGNLLIDCWLPDWSIGGQLAEKIKRIPGAIETSLFSGICKKAVIAGTRGTNIVAAKL